MRRYERIEELRKSIDWRYLDVQVRHYPLHMVNLETVQKAEEREREAISTLRSTLEALQELKELTGIEAKVSSTSYNSNTVEKTAHNEHLYEIEIPKKIWDAIIASQEVCVADSEEVEDKQKEKWNNLAPLEKLEKVVCFLEADMTLREQIAFLEEEIGE